MVYNIILCDTREKGNKKILEYFDNVNQDYIITKLDAGDYMLYKNYNVIIDKKDGLLEVAHNLCNTEEHQRVVREINKAKELGCKRFIFLIQDDKIKSLADIKNWISPHTKVCGETLLKIMITMKSKYGVEFIIVPKRNMGAYIIKLLELGGRNENNRFIK